MLHAVIRTFHLLFVAFVTLAPFTSNRALLVLHALIVPFLWLHWLLNDDTCALTVLENRLRGVSNDSSFFHALVSPVYKIRDSTVRALCWGATLALWGLTLRKVGWDDVVLELGLPRRWTLLFYRCIYFMTKDSVGRVTT